METPTLEDKVDGLTALVGELVAQQRRQQEFWTDLGPIAREVMTVATERLDGLEQRGLFALGREGLAVLDAVTAAVEPQDVRALAESAVAILDAVRAVTQPEVMALVAEAGEVMQHGDELAGASPWDVLSAGRDPDLRRGVAVVVEVLKQVGRVSQGLHPPDTTDGRARRERLLDRRTAPRSRRPRPPAEEIAPGGVSRPAEPTLQLEGWELDAGGFLADADLWTEDFAHQMAAQVGVPALTEEHWRVIRFARADWDASRTSPNIRRITLGSGVSTKALYALWPCSPGKTTARVAGLPKPVGCL